MKKRKPVKILLGVLIFFVVLEIIAYILAWPRQAAEELASIQAQDAKSGTRLAKENSLLQRKIEQQRPRGVYIVVDTGNNILYLKKGADVLRKAVVSCGSGSILEEPGGRRRWVFDTPRGEFFVKSKIKNPDWIKPDWAFIEEGENIPDDPRERIESGVLGDYALGFGDGYFIHGTLYTRMLGRSVTHGCIRVGDGDLRAIFEAASLNTKIYIY